VRFGDLRFIVNLQGGLEPVCSPNSSNDIACSDSIVDSLLELPLDAPRADTPMRAQHPTINCGSVEQQLGVFLGDQLTQDNLHRVFFSIGNVMLQLSGGEPISLELLSGRAPVALPIGMCNAAKDTQRLAMLHMSLERTNIEFVGMEGYMSESMHDLLAEASESLSDSGSNEVGHHPLHEYLMENLPDGHVNDGNGEATPLPSPDNNDGMGGGERSIAAAVRPAARPAEGD
jgi:hypothetical protein